jgi:succinoglycan biosynthesis transport protein ExoP
MRTKAVSADSLTIMLMRVRRRWRVFAVVSILVAAMVMTASRVLVPQFTATSAVLIEPDRSPIERHDTTGDNPIADSAEVESQVEMIRSPRLLQAMLRLESVRDALTRACQYSAAHSSFATLGLYLDRVRRYAGMAANSAPCIFDQSSAVVDAVGRDFTIFQVGRSRVVSVSFRSSLPDTAALVVNSLVGEYLADNIKAKSDARMATAKWLEDEGLKLRHSLVQREQQIDGYRREHGLLHGQQALVTQESLSSLIAHLGTAKARFADATSRSDEVQAAARGGDDVATTPVVLTAGTIRDMRALEAQLTRDIGALTTKYGEHHPKVVAAENELNRLRAALSAESGRIVKGLAAEVASASSDQQALEATLDKAKGEAASAADADSAVQSLVRDADIDRQLYFVLASRSKELETETRAQNPSAQLVNLAEVPVHPSFPRTMPFMGAALLLGFVTGAGAAFSRDYADKTLRNIDEFTDDVEVPVLARIPVERGLSRRANFMRMVSDDRSGFREAIRALYAHVQLRGDLQTILVTSSSPRKAKRRSRSRLPISRRKRDIACC